MMRTSVAFQVYSILLRDEFGHWMDLECPSLLCMVVSKRTMAKSLTPVHNPRNCTSPQSGSKYSLVLKPKKTHPCLSSLECHDSYVICSTSVSLNLFTKEFCQSQCLCCSVGGFLCVGTKSPAGSKTKSSFLDDMRSSLVSSSSNTRFSSNGFFISCFSLAASTGWDSSFALATGSPGMHLFFLALYK